MDPLILSIETHYDRFIESIADYLQTVDRLQRCNEEVKDAGIEKNDIEIDTVSPLELQMILELKKANEIEHLKNCYKNLKGALESAKSSVETERRLLQMWLGEQASAALFNNGLSAEFDTTDLAQYFDNGLSAVFDTTDLTRYFNSSPPIYEDVPPHGRADAVLSQDSTDTVVAVPQEGPPHAVSAPPAASLSQDYAPHAPLSESPTDTVVAVSAPPAASLSQDATDTDYAPPATLLDAPPAAARSECATHTLLDAPPGAAVSEGPTDTVYIPDALPEHPIDTVDAP